MIRSVFKIVLCILILVITGPYAFFSVVFHPLHVTVFWDQNDQDEDIFVNLIDESCENCDLVYQEESKRDADKNSKLSMKLKIVYLLNTANSVSMNLSASGNWPIAFVSLLKSFPADHFHPPNVLPNI